MLVGDHRLRIWNLLMFVSETMTTLTPAHPVRSLWVAIILMMMAGVSTWDAADTYAAPQGAAVQTKWAPGQVDADATRVAARSPQLVQRSSVRRQSIASNSGRSTQRPSNGQVQQVGFLEDYGAHGNVCDCNECAGYDPACGIEGGILLAPNCGLEPIYAMEASCGLEPACGMESFGGDACGCDSCSSGYGTCDGFSNNRYCEPARFPLFLPVLGVDWSRFEFFYGTQAFLNPMNVPATGSGTNANSGSFGFHEGFNEGRDLKKLFGIDLSAQFGLRATQNNLEGQQFTDQHRNQIFLTGGLFRRVDYGLQYGVVLDYLSDNWYYDTDLLQLRGELSWKLSPRQNFGFHWMAGLNDDTVPTLVTNQSGTVFNGSQTVQASDQYRAFYRYCFGPTGQWTSYIGGTDNNHFLIGSDIDVPLAGGLSMKVGSTYFAPTGDTSVPKYQSEGWNVGISMVYRPGCRTGSNRYLRPMFNVADNGSFFVYR